MTTALFLATLPTLSAANLQLILGILLAVSEVLGADSRIKANGLVSFAIIQLRNLIQSKKG